MNLGDAMQSLTVSQSVITDYYQKEEYAHAEFKVKDTSVFTDDVLRYFNTEIHSGIVALLLVVWLGLASFVSIAL